MRSPVQASEEDRAALLVAADPGNAEWQRDVFVSCFKMGGLHAKQLGRVKFAVWYF